MSDQRTGAAQVTFNVPVIVSGREPKTVSRARGVRWAIVAVATTLLTNLIFLAFNSRFFYIDDSEASAFGQYWEIGNRVLALDWPLVNPRIWQSGNYLAESSWGVYSPILWLVGIGAHLATNAAVYITLVKFLFLAVASLGCYLLARSFGARPQWAAIAAIGIPLNGVTVYLDSASWANGLMSWSLIPVTWWAIRRTVRDRRNPLPAILLGCGVVGISYLHATLMLAVILAGTLAEAALRRDRGRLYRALALCLTAGSMAVVVHLPGLLTSSFSGRSQGIANSGNVTVDASDLISSAIASGTPYMNFMGNSFPGAPLTYLAWFLPLVAFVGWRAVAKRLRGEIAIVVVLVVALMILLGPSDVGVLRFPIRVLPFVSLCAITILVVGLSTSAVWNARRLAVALAIMATSTYFALSAGPGFWKAVAVVAVAAIAGIVAVYLLSTDRDTSLTRGIRRITSAVRLREAGSAVVVVMILVTLFTSAAQHKVAFRAPLRDYGMPTSVDALRGQTDGYVGDVFVVGAVEKPLADPGIWNETLVGNLWYIDGAPVQNAYSTVYNAAYSSHVCMGYNGFTCSDAYRLLFVPQPDTGELLVDLLGINTVQVIKESVPQWVWSRLPDGWSVIENNDYVRTIVRDDPIPPAGGVVWQSSGTSVDVRSESDTSVTFHVDELPADGGRVALSRIPWPGYSVDGGTLSQDSMEGFLLTVDLPASSAGQDVTVSFTPPGFAGQTVFGGVIAVVTLGWLFLRLGRSRRDDGTPPTAEEKVKVTA